MAGLVVVGMVALLVGLAIYGARRRARRHNDPKASKELMRSLRRQRVRSLTLPNAPSWVLVAIAAVCLLLVLGAAANLVSPDPGDTASPAEYAVMLVIALSGVVGTALAVLRRRRGARQPYI